MECRGRLVSVFCQKIAREGDKGSSLLLGVSGPKSAVLRSALWAAEEEETSSLPSGKRGLDGGAEAEQGQIRARAGGGEEPVG